MNDVLQLDYQQRINAVVAKHPVFAGLSSADIADLTSKMTTQRVLGGSVVVGQEDEGEGLYIVAAGRIRLAITGDHGREVTLSVLSAGELFGEVSAFDGGPSGITATALYPSTLLVLKRDQLAGCIAKYPSLAKRLLSQMASRIRHADETIAELALCDVSERILRRLQAIARKEGKEGPEGLIVSKPPTHQDLAHMVGSCRETVCRAINALVRQGVLKTQGKELIIRHRAVSPPREERRLAKSA